MSVNPPTHISQSIDSKIQIPYEVIDGDHDVKKDMLESIKKYSV